MSGYSRREVTDSYFAEPAVQKPKKASESSKGKQHDENKRDHREIQHDTPVQNCALSDIKILNVCSLSKTNFNYNSSEAKSTESYLDPVDPNDWKLLSESDVKRKPLDSHSASESSNKSDCDVREVGTWISENVSTTADVHKGKNLNESTFIDLTGEGPVFKEPKLSVTPTVSTPVSKFSRINTRSMTYSQPAGIETLTGNPDAQKRSNSSVGQSIVPSENKSKPDIEEDIEYKSSDKKFCCVLSWTASIYGQQRQCPCALARSTTRPSQDPVPQSSTSVKQLALHIQSSRDYVLIKDLDSSRRTVQKEATSPPNVNTQGPFKLPLDKRRKSKIQNEEKRQTYYLRKKSGVRQRKTQVHELSEGEISNSKEKRESMLNSVSALQICGEGKANVLDRQEKAVVTLGQKTLTGLKDDYEKRLIPTEESKCARNKGTPSIHPKQSDFGEISVHKKCSTSVHYQNTGLKANIEPYRQSLTHDDQEYPSNWTDPMSEKLTHLELDKHDINPDCFSEVINQNECSNEGINKSLDNMEDLMKQREQKSLHCQDGSSYVPLGTMLSGNEKTEKIQNNTHRKEFCCMLGWSAQVCGERSKCSCSLVSSTANCEGNELTSYISHQSSKNKSPLIEDDQPSGPPMKYESNLCKKPVENIQKNWKSKEYISEDKSAVGKIKSLKSQRTNSEGKCESASGLPNSATCDTKANTRDRRKKTQTDVLHLNNKKTTQPPSSEITNAQEPVHNLMCVTEDKQNAFVKKKRSSATFPKSNCTDTSKNIISSEKASEIFSSAESGSKNPLLSARDMSAQDTCNLDVHFQKVKEHRLLKSCQRSKVKDITNPHVSRKSVHFFDTGETISDLEAKSSQLRKSDAVQELSKTNAQNINDFSVLPLVQKLMGEMLPENVSEDKRDSPDKLKNQTKSKNLFIPSETTKTPATSIEKAYNLRLDKQNISPLKTSELPPSPKCRPKCCFLCDKNDQKTKTSRKLKTPTKKSKDQVVKSSQKMLLHKGSSFISPSKTHSKRSNPELLTKVEISKHDECIVKYSNDFTPAVQETKGNDEYEKCAQKLGNEDQLGHQGRRKRQGQKKRKSTIRGSESGSAKRRKATQSKQKAPPAEKKPTLPTCDAVVKTPDVSSGLKGQSNLQEKIILKRCVLKLHRLPFPLDGKFLMYNPIEMGKNCKVEAKADTEQREKQLTKNCASSSSEIPT